MNINQLDMLEAIESKGDVAELSTYCCRECGTSGFDFSAGDC